MSSEPETRRIIWEKWTNPLGGGPEFAADGDHDASPDAVRTAVRPVVPTTAGLMPVNIYANFASEFDFWMMHTNFNISKKCVNALKEVPGVETLDVAMRYRARVGFGKCFDAAAVQRDIGRALGVPDPEAPRDEWHLTLDRDTQDRVDMLIRRSQEAHRFWLVYVLPNGEIAYAADDDGAAYENKLDLFTQARELAGGRFYQSHED